MDTTKFLFRGFLPREEKLRKVALEELKDRTETLIFYEAPHRLINTLQSLNDNLGCRRISLCRELTKMHEEILRLSLTEAVQYYTDHQPRGEYVLVVEGKSLENIELERKAKWENISIEEHIVMYINQGLDKKSAIKMVAKERNVPKSEIYKYSHEIR